MKIHRFCLLILLLLITACAGPTFGRTLAPTGTQVPPVGTPAPALPTPFRTATLKPLPTLTPGPSPTPIPTLEGPSVYNLGQVAKINTLGMAVLKVSYSDTLLIITLAARNDGRTPSQYISAEQFRVTQAGGPAVKTGDCPAAMPLFEGFLQPGDILHGSLCWSGSSGGRFTLEFHDLSSKVLATWDILGAGETALPDALATASLSNPLHHPGETVPFQDYTISLDQIVTTPGDLSSDALVNIHIIFANPGSADITIPAELISSVEIKAADGEKLTPTTAGANCTEPNLHDAVIAPGKNLSVGLCFTGPSPQPGGWVILTNRSDAGQFDFINWSVE